MDVIYRHLIIQSIHLSSLVYGEQAKGRKSKQHVRNAIDDNNCKNRFKNKKQEQS
jgi:hypothetical protein